jgi:hypothetical protein
VVDQQPTLQRRDPKQLHVEEGVYHPDLAEPPGFWIYIAR